MVLNKRILSGFAVLLLCLASLSAQATTYEAVGIAPIDGGGIEQARKAAIRDATRQASIQAGVEVEMSETVTPGGLPLQSTRMRAPKEFASVTVVREWREGEFLHVLVRADDHTLRDQAGTARAYKKKVVATQFSVNVPRQIVDLGDLWNGLPRELMARLEASKQVLPRAVPQGLFADASQINSDAGRALVRQVAEQQDAQFVISGVVLDAGVALEGGYYGFFKTPKRRFEMDIFVHDGLTGALLGQHRLGRAMSGTLKLDRDRPFGSAAFYATDYGRGIDALLTDATQAILADLARLPFAAKIVQITGSRIFLDAGATSSIGTGDTMVVYQRKDEMAINALRNSAEIGIPEMPVTTVSITQVQPLFASGELQGDPKVVKVKVGDLVRFETQQ